MMTDIDDNTYNTIQKVSQLCKKKKKNKYAMLAPSHSRHSDSERAQGGDIFRSCISAPSAPRALATAASARDAQRYCSVTAPRRLC